jgi:alpha-amylase/alpha-mannosidase (GH57 family)
MADISHALVLNFHQPPGNLDYLLEHNEWEAREILFALDRMPRSLWLYEDVAHVHLALSGTLLETLSSSAFQRRVYGIIDVGSFLWSLQNQNLFEILGTGYYHPVLPLTPEADWDDHLQRWLGIGRHLFWRTYFPGFWPPEMGFCMEIIPHLKRCGYNYVLVDSEYVEPINSMCWQEVRYRPHIAEYEDERITVIVRDRDLSNAQLAGMEYEWFVNELHERTQWCDFVPLVTTVSDGDNGGWFRNLSKEANFWTFFYSKLLEARRRGETNIKPVSISNYLNEHGVHGQVKIHRGAWNTDTHHGCDFMQWTGSQVQKSGWAYLHEVSKRFHNLRHQASEAHGDHPDVRNELSEAQWHLLRAETSCNFYWGDSWVDRAFRDLDEASYHIDRACTALGLR